MFPHEMQLVEQIKFHPVDTYFDEEFPILRLSNHFVQ